MLNLCEVARELAYISNLITQGDNHWININSVCNFIAFYSKLRKPNSCFILLTSELIFHPICVHTLDKNCALQPIGNLWRGSGSHEGTTASYKLRRSISYIRQNSAIIPPQWTAKTPEHSRDFMKSAFDTHLPAKPALGHRPHTPSRESAVTFERDGSRQHNGGNMAHTTHKTTCCCHCFSYTNVDIHRNRWS